MQLFDGSHAKSFVNWMFEDQPMESQDAIYGSLEDIMLDTAGHAGFLGIRAATEHGSIAAYVMLYPGKIAILTGPHLSRSSNTDTDALEVLAAEICGSLARIAMQRWDIEMVQATVNVDAESETSSLNRAGFRRLATLHQLVILLPAPVELPDADAEPNCWSQATRQDLPAIKNWLESTYINTEDCPEISLLRLTESVLDGYWTMSTGIGSKKIKPTKLELPAWWIFRDASSGTAHEIQTAYLLTQIQPSTWELSYFGVGVNYRGQGLGKRTLHHALRKLHELNATQLYAYVDSRNEPAIHMYDAIGFRLAGSWNAYYFAGS